ncbi:hypothetical protein HGM15179_012824 [Zosterops borbonicus]|uniref:Uncharacterized protein n=1 Tax=Zosterops borbonicus TaxID=364589 RepID=A0A8K1LHJ4_9PASS|nr:hypothetical protein HGM15179_012824 [Zosterops borbonicus]
MCSTLNLALLNLMRFMCILCKPRFIMVNVIISSKMVDKFYHIDSILCLSQTQESFWKKGVFGSVSVGKGASFLVEEIRAMTWCPWQSKVLATGDGMKDGILCVWHVNCEKIIQSAITDLQSVELLEVDHVLALLPHSASAEVLTYEVLIKI